MLCELERFSYFVSRQDNVIMYSEISVNIVINVTNINNIYQQNIFYLGKENIFILWSHLFTRRLSGLVRADRFYPGKLNLMEKNQNNQEKGRKSFYSNKLWGYNSVSLLAEMTCLCYLLMKSYKNDSSFPSLLIKLIE